MTSLNAADLQTYSASQVSSLADLDHYSVRDEGFRRQDAASKKLAKLRKQIAAAEREMADAEVIIRAAFAAEQVSA